MGLVGGVREALRRRCPRGGPIDTGVVLAAMLVVVPLLVLTFASGDRKDRYLLPLVGPAAVLAAWGLREVMRGWPRVGGGGRLAIGLHWALLAGVAVALPVVGAVPGGPLRTRDGGPWFSWAFALPVACGLGATVMAGVVTLRRWRTALPVATAAVMLVLQVVAVWGYARSDEGTSEMRPMADAVWAAWPDAVTYFRHNRRAPNDLAIYLDRPTRQITAAALAGIEPAERPSVVVLIQKEDSPAPRPPAGWAFVAKIARGKDWLHAFVMPAKGAARSSVRSFRKRGRPLPDASG